MKSTKNPGNLRDFRIDERSPDREPPSAPTQSIGTTKQWVKPRQSPSLNEWNSPNSLASGSLSESAPAADSLWSDWEREAGADEGIDLAQPVALPPQASTRPGAVAAQRPPVPAPIEAAPTASAQQGQARTDSANGFMPWAAELALEERRMERAGTVDYTNQYQRQEILRARTREFTSLLQKLFREHVEVFNASRGSPAHHIHVYKVSKTEEDFMLYRNHVKLVISGQRSGRVLFAFNQYMGQIFAPTQAPVVEIEATWGPFDQLYWSYKGERLQMLDLVRYFITEFVRQSFR